MSRYPSEGVARFDQQFAESPQERNERLRYARDRRAIAALYALVADLSVCLTDEGADWSQTRLRELRRRAANALPPTQCPDWLVQFRDPPVVQS